MVLKDKTKVIKRDDTKDKRITRTNAERREALDRRRRLLLKEVRQIERELQTA